MQYVPTYQPTYQPQQQIYQQQQQTYQQPQQLVYPQQNDTIFVNGVNEASAWVVQRGQTVRLWDSNEPKFYIKSVGSNGMPNPIEVYRYEQENAPEKPEQKEYITRQEFEKRLSEITRPKFNSDKKEGEKR